MKPILRHSYLIAACLASLTVACVAAPVQHPAAPAQASLDDLAARLLTDSRRGNVADAKVILKAHPELLNELSQHGFTPLLAAIDSGSLSMTRFLLNAGAETEMNGSALEAAARASGDWRKLIELVLAHGVKINEGDWQGRRTALAVAVNNEDNLPDAVERVKFLLSKGAEPMLPDQDGTISFLSTLGTASPAPAQAVFDKLGKGWRDEFGNTHFILAARYGNRPLMAALLGQGARVDEANYAGDTALHFAAERNPEQVHELLTEGADPNLADYAGDLPLHLALHTLSLLPSRSYDFETHDQGTPPDRERSDPATPLVALIQLIESTKSAAPDRYGFTDLLLADLTRDREVRDLVAQRAPQAAADTTFMDACAQGDLPRVQALAAAQSGLTNLRTSTGLTPLHMAALWGTSEVAKFLVEQGADVNARDAKGRTPLVLALALTQDIYLDRARKMVTLLLRNGANVNLFGTDWHTPLQEAVAAGDPAILGPILQKSVHLDQPGSDKDTVLVQAILQPDGLALVEKLLARGAAVNSRNQRGATPLMAAVCEIHWKEVKLLLSHGARVNEQDEMGETALSDAINGFDEGQDRNLAQREGTGEHSPIMLIAQLLVQKGAILVDDGNQVMPGDTEPTSMARVLEFAERVGGTDEIPLARAVLIAHPEVVRPHSLAEATPLAEAIAADDFKMVTLLLNFGAKANQPSQGHLPIFYSPDQQMKALLLAHGARSSAPTHSHAR